MISPSRSPTPSGDGILRRRSGVSPTLCRPYWSSPPASVRCGGNKSRNLPKTSASALTLLSLQMLTMQSLISSCRHRQESPGSCAHISSSPKCPATAPLAPTRCPTTSLQARLGRKRCRAITSLKTGVERPVVGPGRPSFQAVDSLSSSEVSE